MIRLIAFAAICAFTLQANDIQIGQPVYAGNGCSPGTAFITLNPDSLQLTITFSEYKLSQKGHASCNIAIPIRVPTGYSIAFNALMLTGNVSLDTGATAQISTESFFAGSRGPLYAQKWSGPISRGFETPSGANTLLPEWSPCGADVILRLNTSITLNPIENSSGFISIDNMRTPPGISTLINWKRC